MKKISVLLVMVLAASTTAVTSYSAKAVQEGAVCKKVNRVAYLGNLKFKCVNKNKKLIWQTVKPKPTKPPALPEFWPLDKPAKVVDLALIADASVRKYVADANQTPEIKVLIGPATSKNSADKHLKHLEKTTRLWSKDWLPETVHVAIGTIPDYLWIKPIWEQYGLNGGGFDNSQSTWSRCGGGSAIYANTPFFWGCYNPRAGDHIGIQKFASHEYTHLVQYGVIGYKHGNKVRNFPNLFSEGSADFYGVTFASEPKDVEINWTTYWMAGYIAQEIKPELRQASVARIEELINDAMRDSKLAPSHWYWTGAYATMRLVAAKGHEGFIDYMNEYGKTGDVFKSFETIYGMTFEQFAKIIAPEVKALTTGLQR